MALVICCVLRTERMRRRISLSVVFDDEGIGEHRPSRPEDKRMDVEPFEGGAGKNAEPLRAGQVWRQRVERIFCSHRMEIGESHGARLRSAFHEGDRAARQLLQRYERDPCFDALRRVRRSPGRFTERR